MLPAEKPRLASARCSTRTCAPLSPTFSAVDGARSGGVGCWVVAGVAVVAAVADGAGRGATRGPAPLNTPAAASAAMTVTNNEPATTTTRRSIPPNGDSLVDRARVSRSQPSAGVRSRSDLAGSRSCRARAPEDPPRTNQSSGSRSWRTLQPYRATAATSSSASGDFGRRQRCAAVRSAAAPVLRAYRTRVRLRARSTADRRLHVARASRDSTPACAGGAAASSAAVARSRRAGG
jgi:hypothetical protein